MSQFGADKFTTRSREVIEAAQLAATTGGNTHTEPVHLLVALLRQEDGTSRSLVMKAGVDAALLQAKAAGRDRIVLADGSALLDPRRLADEPGLTLFLGRLDGDRRAGYGACCCRKGKPGGGGGGGGGGQRLVGTRASR